MPHKPAPLNWEKVSPVWWSSCAGYVMEKDGAWTAYVLRNQRTGAAWTEPKAGFGTAAAAMRWVERQTED